jgi:hypothetical protein
MGLTFRNTHGLGLDHFTVAKANGKSGHLQGFRGDWFWAWITSRPNPP